MVEEVWYFAKEGAYRSWEWDFLEQLTVDWAGREKTALQSQDREKIEGGSWLSRLCHRAKGLVLERLGGRNSRS